MEIQLEKRGLKEMMILVKDRPFAAVMVARFGAAAGMGCFRNETV